MEKENARQLAGITANRKESDARKIDQLTTDWGSDTSEAVNEHVPTLIGTEERMSSSSKNKMKTVKTSSTQ